MKLKIDLDRCYMSGECYYNHPELFKMGEDGHPIILVDDINDEEMRRHAEEAIEVCPAVAISLEE
ncbi:MAG: ferredoxin [Pseudomonadota bacterium]